MKILVCGGRNFDDWKLLHATLDSMYRMQPITCVVHGDALGADSLADDWTKNLGIERKPYPARWAEEGRSAGPKRNARMLVEEPDIEIVVAFPGGNGTADMVRRSVKADMFVIQAANDA